MEAFLLTRPTARQDVALALGSRAAPSFLWRDAVRCKIEKSHVRAQRHGDNGQHVRFEASSSVLAIPTRPERAHRRSEKQRPDHGERRHQSGTPATSSQ